MLRKPASVVSALSGSQVFVPPVLEMLKTEPGLFSHQDKSRGEALVAECSSKSFCLENSLLEGFSAKDFLATARRIAMVWSW